MEARPLDAFGYPGFSVSQCGSVWKAGKLLKQYTNPRGYRYVNNFKGKSARVHRLVAMAFVPNPDAAPEVNHIDGDKLNNAAVNLEWCTRKQNMRHAFATGLCRVVFGEKAPAAKLTDADVAEIRRLYVPRSRVFSCAALAKRFGVDQSRVHQLVVAAGHKTKARAKIGRELAEQIQKLVACGAKHRDVADLTGVSKTTVGNIARGL